jgi:hypothetical protein
VVAQEQMAQPQQQILAEQVAQELQFLFQVLL